MDATLTSGIARRLALEQLGLSSAEIGALEVDGIIGRSLLQGA